MSRRPIRLLAILEASTVSGPAKNLLEFGNAIREWHSGALDLSIVTFSRGGGPNEFAAAAAAARIPLETLSEGFAGDPRVVVQLRALVQQRAPDIVQTHAVKSHFLMLLSGLWRRRPWVAFHHGYTTTDAKMRAYNQLDRVSLKMPHRVMTVSRAFERQLIERGVAQNRITVIHNSIDPRWGSAVRALDRSAIRQTLGISPHESLALSVGRLSQEKGHRDLIAAVARLRSEGLPLRLILAGEGPERDRLEQSAGEGVIFAGHVSDPAPFYAAADLMVLPSFTEGSPNVLLESMAAELPVVATEAGGIPEIVRHGESALLVKPGDPEALAAAIQETLGHPDRTARRAEDAHRLILERHSPEARSRALLEVYASLV